jgi:hypothetical protein
LPARNAGRLGGVLWWVGGRGASWECVLPCADTGQPIGPGDRAARPAARSGLRPRDQGCSRGRSGFPPGAATARPVSAFSTITAERSPVIDSSEPRQRPSIAVDQWPSPLTESGLLLAAGLLPLWSRGGAPGNDGRRKPWLMSSSPRRTSTRLAAMVTWATWLAQSDPSPPTETNPSPASAGAGDAPRHHSVMGRQTPRDRRMVWVARCCSNPRWVASPMATW